LYPKKCGMGKGVRPAAGRQHGGEGTVTERENKYFKAEQSASGETGAAADGQEETTSRGQGGKSYHLT